MPYKYIGRTTYFKGKTLWEILGNLKNFGVGRIIVRSRFEDKYSEPSFIKILSVETMPEPEVKSMDNPRRIKVCVEKTFRGIKYPEEATITASYKTDYRLVPKDEEKFYTEHVKAQKQVKIFPRTMPFPPLMQELIIREMKACGEPVTNIPEMEIVYRQGVDNDYKVAKEGETPNVSVSASLGTPLAPRLYKGIKL